MKEMEVSLVFHVMVELNLMEWIHYEEEVAGKEVGVELDEMMMVVH